VNVYAGMKEVRREYVEVGVSVTASRLQILRTIMIPGSLHYIFVGLRLGLGWCTIGTVVAELEVGTSGVGELLSVFSQALRVDEVWVPLILLGLFSVLCATVLKRAERWASMPWTRRKGRRHGGR
ncbi:MAG: ABC transporter permease, partial [Steroidobacteraceae bacterium]